MIDFVKNNNAGRSLCDEQVYVNDIQDISSCVSKNTLSKYDLGLKLIAFWTNGNYVFGCEKKKLYKLYKNVNQVCNLHSNNFFAVCEYEFGLEKSVVSRLMNVVDEFGNGSKGLKKEFAKYKYSVLVEMLNLSPDERKGVKSEWTVSQVRDYKKTLVATSQQDEDISSLPPPEEEFPQFKKWKRIDLCRRIVDLEQEIERLKKEQE